MRTTLLTGAAAQPFAHLLGGLGKRRAVRAEEDDKKDPAAARAEGDEDDKKDPDAVRAEGDEDDKKDPDAARARKAKAKAEEDETCAEEDDEDEDIADAARSGRKAERARCRNIFASSAAGLRPDVAAQLAFATNLSSAEAVGILEAAAAGQSPAPAATSRLHDRMARVVVPPVGSDGEEDRKASGTSGAAQAIIAAASKARGGR